MENITIFKNEPAKDKSYLKEWIRFSYLNRIYHCKLNNVPTPKLEKTVRSINDMLKNKRNIISLYFAKHNEHIVACCVCCDFKEEYTDNYVREICDLYVLDEYRKMGIANNLLKEVKKDFTGQINLTALQKNKNAISLYKKHGFEITTVTMKFKK